MDLETLRRDSKATILEIAGRHGVSRVRVFGSFARGQAVERSDLDLLVDAGRETSPFFPGGLIADLEEALALRVDVVEEPGLHPMMREQILREAVAL